jgi:hypothetical protein
MLKSHYSVAPFCQRQIMRRDERRQAMRAVQPFYQLEHSPSILLV